MKTRPFSYWNNLAFYISLVLLLILVVGLPLTNLTSLWWLLLVPLVLQYLFMTGVYIGKWRTVRPGGK